MKLSPYEQETIINFNEAEKAASVYTHNNALRHKLEKLSQERPEECKLKQISRDGRVVDYIIPKAWVRVTPTRILSEAQMKVCREAAQKAHISRFNAPARASEKENTPGSSYTTLPGKSETPTQEPASQTSEGH